MKLGLSVKIDVTKIDKERLFKGEKGTYLDLTTFVDTDTLDQYGNNGFISQSVSKEEREAKVQTPILGNIKVFYNDSENAPHQNHQNTSQPPRSAPNDDFDQDIPFMKYEFRSII
jgi:hypothetical protein